jgi:Protein of unknown function (DUF1264)
MTRGRSSNEARIPQPCNGLAPEERADILRVRPQGALCTPPTLLAQEKPRSPAEGYTIHIVAPHRHEDGTVHGPYHHYCKPITPEIMQCLIFLSTEPNAELVEIEYFIDKKLARTNVTLEQWNKHFHDHQEEVASGRVQVLDVAPEKAQALAEAAAKTDGILFHLWPMGAKIPTGEVMFPTAVSHQPVQQLEIPQ